MSRHAGREVALADDSGALHCGAPFLSPSLPLAALSQGVVAEGLRANAAAGSAFPFADDSGYEMIGRPTWRLSLRHAAKAFQLLCTRLRYRISAQRHLIGGEFQNRLMLGTLMVPSTAAYSSYASSGPLLPALCSSHHVQILGHSWTSHLKISASEVRGSPWY